MMIAQINQPGTDGSYRVGYIAVAALACYGVWRFGRWFLQGPRQPEPWGEDVSAEIEKENLAPLCHHCLTPHDSWADFCPECGATVGTYTNWLPYPYIFSLGDTLRRGTDGDFKRSPLTVIGFFVLSLLQYALFAPIYWLRFLIELLHPRPAPPPSAGAPNLRNS